MIFTLPVISHYSNASDMIAFCKCYSINDNGHTVLKYSKAGKLSTCLKIKPTHDWDNTDHLVIMFCWKTLGPGILTEDLWSHPLHYLIKHRIMCQQYLFYHPAELQTKDPSTSQNCTLRTVPLPEQYEARCRFNVVANWCWIPFA